MTAKKMFELIMQKAIDDERIRAVTMNGSRADKNATHDKYSDFDIVYYVKDIREFTQNRSWIEDFGEILIMQCPMDWYMEPYDYESRDNFNYLIQFKDGNRIDLSLVDISNIEQEKENDEPRIVLLNKDNYDSLVNCDTDKAFWVDKPSEKEFQDTINEFRWVSIYVSKGLCRKQLYYAKHMYDVNVMEMFMKMLNWKIGVDNNFQVSTGAHSKYLYRYLNENEMKRVHSIFPGGEYEDIWMKLFLMYDYFEENTAYVAKHLGFHYDKNEGEAVRDFICGRKKEYDCSENKDH